MRASGCRTREISGTRVDGDLEERKQKRKENLTKLQFRTSPYGADFRGLGANRFPSSTSPPTELRNPIYRGGWLY